MSLPFIHNISPIIKNILKLPNLKITDKSLITVHNLFTKTKNKIPTLQKIDTIYKTNCSCNVCYIGQTNQYLNKRLQQHISDGRLAPHKCSLAAHQNKYPSHTINYTNPQILAIEHNLQKRLFLEVCYISEFKETSCNSNTDLHNLTSIYANLLHIKKKNL